MRVGASKLIYLTLEPGRYTVHDEIGRIDGPADEAQEVAEHAVADATGALGGVLADDILSGIDVPSHDNSAMDGYALCGEHERYTLIGKSLQRDDPLSPFIDVRRSRIIMINNGRSTCAV